MAGPRAAFGALKRLPPAWRIALGAIVAAAVVVLALLLAVGSSPLSLASPPVSAGDPVPYDGRSPGAPTEGASRVLVQLSRPPLGDLPGVRELAAAREQKYVRSLQAEQQKLRSALAADGIPLRDVVTYYRVWDGFAATVPTQDIGKLNSTGARVRTIRRLYPASGEPVPVGGAAPKDRPAPAGQAPIAVLDTGVADGALQGHADGGYDAVAHDRDPAPGRDPSGGGARETSGTALAGVVAQAGERVLPIRVAALTAAPEVAAVGTTDELLSGLERAVDPNGDAVTSDHVPVALVGVNSPYAGFSSSPEAQAIAAAAGLGTLVVAPAGEEGAAAPGSGTIGSPGAAADALAVGALAGSVPAPQVRLRAAGKTVAIAVALGGAPPLRALKLAGPVTSADPAVLGKRTAQLQGRAVLVRAGADPSAQAAAAAAVGAALVIVADPRRRPLAAMAAGRARAPVVGVTGAAATALLKLKAGTQIQLGRAELGSAASESAPRISPSTSQGPSAGGLAKPDLAAAGSAVSVTLAGRPAVVGGGAIAAARVAIVAARLARAHPELTPAQLRAQLIAAADPRRLPPARAGAGVLRTPAGALGSITSDPPAPASGPLDPIELKLSATASAALQLRAAGAQVVPATLTLRPGAPATVAIRPAGPGPGRLEALDQSGAVVASVPFLVRPQQGTPVPLGPLRLAADHSVRFTLGAFERGDPFGAGTRIQFAQRLVLDLVDAHGTVVKALTLPGGATELMPAEYAYTLPKATFAQLPPGRYAFRAQAWAPRRNEPTVRTSASFSR